MLTLRFWKYQLIDIFLGLAIWFYFAVLLRRRSSRTTGKIKDVFAVQFKKDFCQILS